MINSLFSKTKRKILALLFLHPDQQFYLREIMRFTGVSQGTLHRELKSLVLEGILLSEKRNKQNFYSVNGDNPIYNELRGVVIKTFGVADILKEILEPHRKKIKAAFIYGSFASGDETAESDIDLLVVGNISFADLSMALSKTEEALKREINPTVFPAREFRNRIAHDNHFVTSILELEKIFLVGTEDDLRRLAGK